VVINGTQIKTGSSPWKKVAENMEQRIWAEPMPGTVSIQREELER